MSVEDARRALDSDTALLGVVFDSGTPVTLVNREDLAVQPAGQELRQILSVLPPGILVNPEIAVDAFLESGAITALDTGARGALVVDGDEFLGAFTEQSIDDALLKHSLLDTARRGFEALDSGLAGSINTPKVVLYCDEFRHRNELSYYNRLKPPMCQVEQPHPHPLRRP
jgi:hypothetical protein